MCLQYCKAVLAWQRSGGQCTYCRNETRLFELLSHTRTVVWECCKGDEASQWRNPKFDPPPRTHTVSDRKTNRHTWLRRGPLHQCNSSSRSAQAYRFCACVTLRTKNVLVFLGFLQLTTAKGPGWILTQNTPKHALPRKKCAFLGSRT